jgi:hypothetical protein
MPKDAEKYVCELCDFKCSKLSNYNSHLSTDKHKNQQKSTKINKCQQKSTNVNANSCHTKESFQCNCGRIYRDRSGLWRHKKQYLCVEQEKEQCEEIKMMKEAELKDALKALLEPIESKLMAQTYANMTANNDAITVSNNDTATAMTCPITSTIAVSSNLVDSS